MADNHQDPASILLAQSIAAGFALSAYGFGLTASLLGMVSETFAAAATTVQEGAETVTPKPKPSKTATVLSFETAKAKSAKPAKPIAAEGTTTDLKLISGIGPKLEQLLNGLGILSILQIAKWSSDDAARIDGELQLNGRILRDDWTGQAKNMAEGRHASR